MTVDPHDVVSGRYEVIRPLGHGSFGRTFLARDRELAREVALKVFDLRGAPDWKAVELFEREAAVLQGLRHHGIPAVFDTVRGSWEGGSAVFLVLEYIEGTSVAQLIETGQPLEDGAVATLFLELLSILEYIHTRVPPILHRDIKPANIIVRPGGLPVLVDFGSVRRTLMTPEETGSTIAGTYGYMPYEQYMGQATPASDLYALAATFLHLLTGRPPRDFMNEEGRINVPDMPAAGARLQPILARMLRPSPADRFATAQQVRQAMLAATALQIVPQRAALSRTPVLAVLPPAPRAIEGTTAEWLDRVAPTAWDLMDASNKPTETFGVVEVLLFGFFSVMTLGMLPAVFFSMARTQRRRLLRFFQEGQPATATITKIELEPSAFGEKLARVSYEFEADGHALRDSDRVRPVIANKWLPGDVIQVLYIPDRAYDSVIISTA